MIKPECPCTQDCPNRLPSRACAEDCDYYAIYAAAMEVYREYHELEVQGEMDYYAHQMDLNRKIRRDSYV